jgi:hypothetical protein
MESSGDHGRRLKPLQPWTTPPAGHNFSLAAGCFPWPLPSSSCYTCGYCRREFRSAQALGGHMNVHRRDRARLRQCCSAASAAHGPSSSLPSPSLMTAHHQHSRAPPLPNLNFSPPHRAAADPVIYSFFSATTTSAAAAATNKAAALEVSLELGIGVCGSGSGRGAGLVEEDGLDLELRLGCAWE